MPEQLSLYESNLKRSSGTVGVYSSKYMTQIMIQ